MTNEKAKGRLESFIDTFNICKEHDNALVAVSIMKEDIQAFTQAIKALEQQPCEDWYDVPSDEMTLEQARQAVKDLRKKLAEYLKQQPCEDCISRKDMLAIFRQSNSLSQAWDGFEKLPSVTPKEKTAAWVPTDEEPHEDYECNKCGYGVSTFTANIEPHTEYKYCPNCGARMVSK